MTVIVSVDCTPRPYSGITFALISTNFKSAAVIDMLVLPDFRSSKATLPKRTAWLMKVPL